MRKHYTPLSRPRHDPRYHRFSIPNRVWEYHLRPVEFMLLSYLFYYCSSGHSDAAVSVETVSEAVHLTGTSKNNAMKSISALLEVGLITVESNNYFDKRGMKWTGNNLYTILPVRSAVDAFHQQQLQLRQLDLEAEPAVPADGKRNTTAITPERPCVPRLPLKRNNPPQLCRPLCTR